MHLAGIALPKQLGTTPRGAVVQLETKSVMANAKTITAKISVTARSAL